MFSIALLIFILVSPILFLPLSVPGLATLQWYQFGFFTNNIEVVQRQIFMYGSVLLIIISLFDKPKRLFGDDYLRFFLLVCFCCVYAHPITIKIFPTVFLGALLYYLVSVCTNVKNLSYFFMAVALVSFINTVFSILQCFHIHFLLFKENEIIGLMAYKSQLGIYQAIALPLCYSLNPWLSIIPTIGLLLSNSATAMVAATVGMIYLLWKRGLRIQSIPMWQVFLVVAGYYLYGHWGKLEIRLDAWVYAITGGVQHIFKGNGIGLFHFEKATVSLDNSYVKFTDPYSLYLEVFWSVGVFGLIATLIFIGDKLLFFKTNDKMEYGLFTSCFILFLVGFGYSFMDYPRLAGTAIVLFGLLTAIKGDKNSC